MTAPAATTAAGVPAGVLETGAAAGAAVLALTSTGSMVVAAVLLAVAAASRWTLAATLLATAAVAVRFSTVTFDDVAGIQSVLGSAGTVGPTTAAASAWLASGAVVFSLRTRVDSSGLHRCVVALAGGATAAAIAVGAGPGGDLVHRVAATTLATVVGFVVMRSDASRRVDRARVGMSVIAGLAALVLAGWPA